MPAAASCGQSTFWPDASLDRVDDDGALVSVRVYELPWKADVVRPFRQYWAQLAIRGVTADVSAAMPPPRSRAVPMVVPSGAPRPGLGVCWSRSWWFSFTG